jgi:hypothetical protein
MKPGRARRQQTAAVRARRQRQRRALDPVVRARLDRFVDAFTRWNALRGEPTNDECPFCGALVVIKPGATSNDYLHLVPACPPWMPALMALGAHSPRSEVLGSG